jgi:hypothetical protein
MPLPQVDLLDAQLVPLLQETQHALFVHQDMFSEQITAGIVLLVPLIMPSFGSELQIALHALSPPQQTQLHKFPLVQLETG